MHAAPFSQALLDWYAIHGRKQLPWQRRGPYAVWLSEIMLQQTQVATVIPYFERFTNAFPDVPSLANATTDQVLRLWSGLGYYARARNLHRAAQMMVANHHGNVPGNFDALLALPGIGRSTAGAILAQAFNQRHAILDGNVRRVLTRYYALRGWPGKRDVEEHLWHLADQLTPQEHVADYTQAMMDLGATVCLRRKPLCDACPVRTDCMARLRNEVELYPTPRARKALPVRRVTLPLIYRADKCILLQQRPPTGIWGGLWSLPECQATNIKQWCADTLGLKIKADQSWPAFRHTFSHFHLDIKPVPARLLGAAHKIRDNAAMWFNPLQPADCGLPKPVQDLLQRFAHNHA